MRDFLGNRDDPTLRVTTCRYDMYAIQKQTNERSWKKCKSWRPQKKFKNHKKKLKIGGATLGNTHVAS